MVWKYGIVQRKNGKLDTVEIFFGSEGNVLSCIKVNVIISNQPTSHPEKASLEEVKQNYFQEVGTNQYVKVSM